MLALPRIASQDAYSRLDPVTQLNAVTQLPAAEPNTAPMPFMDPAFAVAVCNGTVALTAALMAHGIGPGDEVIVPAFSFFATAESVANVGARPVFGDVNESTFNLDPGLIEAKITPRTKALMPVHLFGRPSDMDAVMDVA